MIRSISLIGKILRSKLRSSSFGKEGRHGKEEMSALTIRSTNVNEEYKEAFRTMSCTDICNKVQGQLGTRINLDDGKSLSFSSSSSSSTMASPPSSPPTEQVRLLEYLVEPHLETLISTSESSKYHQFLGNYFDISLEAGRICEFVLQNLYQVRLNYHTIRNVVTLIERSPDHTSWSHNQYNWLFKDLASFSMHRNPFSSMTPKKFQDLRDTHIQLLHQLTSQYCIRKTKRGTVFIRWIKRGLAVVGCGALAMIMKKKLKRSKQEQMEVGGARELDIAAKGVYVLIKDFDTMSLLVKILHDEMEHNKSVAERCVAEICGMTRKNQIILKQVTTEFQMRDHSCFQEHLQELEQQIYLSFVDINRSRKLLLQQLDIAHDGEH